MMEAINYQSIKKIDIEPTTYCNLDCTYCQRTYWARKSQHMLMEKFAIILQNFPSLERVKIQGIGEPLLNPDFFPMVEYARIKDIFVESFTNGTMLHINDNIEKIIVSGLNRLCISIDTCNEKLYEQLRVGGNYYALVRNIELLTKRASNNDISIEFWSVLTNNNIHEMPNLVKLAKDLGVKKVNFQTILNTFSYKPEVYDSIKGLSLRTELIGYTNLINTTMLDAKRSEIDVVFQKSKAHNISNPCHWPFDTLFISADGFIVPCCTIADPTVLNMGNLFNERIEKIWGNPIYQNFRQRLLTGDIPIPCQNCYSNDNQIISNFFKSFA